MGSTSVEVLRVPALVAMDSDDEVTPRRRMKTAEEPRDPLHVGEPAGRLSARVGKLHIQPQIPERAVAEGEAVVLFVTLVHDPGLAVDPRPRRNKLLELLQQLVNDLLQVGAVD